MKNYFVLAIPSATPKTVILNNPTVGVTYSEDSRITVKTAYSGKIKTYRQYLPLNARKRSIRLNYDQIDEQTFFLLRDLIMAYSLVVHKTGSLYQTITYVDWRNNSYKVRINQQTLDSIVNGRYYARLDGYSFNLILDIDEATQAPVISGTSLRSYNTSTRIATIAVSSNASNTTITESIPTGLTVSSISTNGIWDSANRTITWSLGSGSGTVTYAVNGYDGTYTISGSAQMDYVSTVTGGTTNFVLTTATAGTAVRSITGLTVSIVLNGSHQPMTYVETYGSGLTPSSFGSAVHNAGARTLTWTISATSQTVSYVVSGSAATYTLSGTLTVNGSNFTASGPTSLVISASASASGSRGVASQIVTITYAGSTANVTIVENLAVGVTPTNYGTATYSAVSRTLTWILTTTSGTVSYTVTASNGTYTLGSGTVSVTGASASITGTSSITITNPIVVTSSRAYSGTTVTVTVTTTGSGTTVVETYPTGITVSSFGTATHNAGARTLTWTVSGSGGSVSYTIAGSNGTYTFAGTATSGATSITTTGITSVVISTITANCARTISGTSVTLNWTSSAAPTNIIEILPSGLTPVLIPSGAQWSSTTGELRWNSPSGTSGTLSYSVQGNDASYIITGTITVSGTTNSTTGNNTVTISTTPTITSVRSLASNVVSIVVNSTHQPITVVEDVAPNLTVSGHTGTYNSTTRKITWILTSLSQTLTYTITGPNGSYALSGTATVSTTSVNTSGTASVTLTSQPPASQTGTIVRAVTDNNSPVVKVTLTVTPDPSVTTYQLVEYLPDEPTTNVKLGVIRSTSGAVLDDVANTITWSNIANTGVKVFEYWTRSESSGTAGTHTFTQGGASFSGGSVIAATGASSITKVYTTWNHNDSYYYGVFVIMDTGKFYGWQFDRRATALTELSAGNAGNSTVRSDWPDADIYVAPTHSESGYIHGNFIDGESYKVTVWVPADAAYNIFARVSTSGNPANIMIASYLAYELGTAYSFRARTVADTGSYTNYVESAGASLNLKAGINVIRVSHNNSQGPFNLDYVRFVKI